MRVILFLIALLSIGSFAGAQSDSSRYTVTLLTCAPGNQLYSTFGHSAVRVVDQLRRTDAVYNYGIFDFDTPNFYVKFVRGKLQYKLGRQTFRGFLREYEYYKRDVWENKFDLTDAEAEKFVGLLEENHKPENRYYAYDFFFDNCSSRIRDVYEKATGRTLESSTAQEEQTYRHYLDYYIKDKPWSDFGIDLILGRPADDVISYRNQMFLPDYLKLNMEESKAEAGAVLGPSKTIYAFPSVKDHHPLYTQPIFWTSFLLLIGLLFTFWKPNALGLRIFDGTLFTIAGIAGSLFLFMWLGTDHQACFANWNMLWLFPLNIFFSWALFKKEIPRKIQLYFMFVAFLLSLAIVGWFVIPQQYHIAFLPWMLLMLLRLVFRTSNLGK